MRPTGLEVVVPRGFDQRHIPDVLADKREWIARATRQMEERRARLAVHPPCLPAQISLPAVAEEWQVEYRAPEGAEEAAVRCGRERAVRVREAAGHRLVVAGDPRDFEGCKRGLLRWLSRRAHIELPRRLEALAREHGFEYGRVTVRQQRTRWGSCSRQGNISVNARLLLLPSAACDYVLVHELCHTRRMDHSSAFWDLLEKHDPDYKTHKKLVRDAARALPTWLDHEPDESAM